ncbi:DUF1467 family protein, partial [uncultured Caulobacter sp.]|uniref:DUF1467 family protein n=1 Tax=uncultured Caulobacter sp. TaxID=158749 RepID=UPI00260626F4
MPLGPVTMIGVYLVVWWTVLFAVLPLGQALAAEIPLYPTGPSEDSAFLRFFNAGETPLELNAANGASLRLEGEQRVGRGRLRRHLHHVERLRAELDAVIVENHLLDVVHQLGVTGRRVGDVHQPRLVRGQARLARRRRG